MIKSIYAAAAVLATLAAPASAQNAASRTAGALDGAKITAKAWPVGYKIDAIDAASDPWKPVTSAQMAATQPKPVRKKAYSVSTKVDYNRDGIVDTAFIANNSRQGAVLVALGGNKGTVVAFKVDGKLEGGQELATSGKNRIVLAFPESNAVLLSVDGGRQAVYYIGDED